MKDWKIEIYADGANLDDMIAAHKAGFVKGFTTNPTLMRKAGITNYEAFAREVLSHISDLPISFEVFSDDFADMERQALKIASWGKNVYVKIPVTNTAGLSSEALIARLSNKGVRLNVTAITTLEQVRFVAGALSAETPAIVSVFAGRIADTGIDPLPLMREALTILRSRPRAQLLWASPREVLNLVQAEDCGCHIITMTPDLIKKISVIGMKLDQMSLETVKMFYDDASKVGYRL